jgi:hypothetical protein
MIRNFSDNVRNAETILDAIQYVKKNDADCALVSGVANVNDARTVANAWKNMQRGRGPNMRDLPDNLQHLSGMTMHLDYGPKNHLVAIGSLAMQALTRASHLEQMTHHRQSGFVQRGMPSDTEFAKTAGQAPLAAMGAGQYLKGKEDKGYGVRDKRQQDEYERKMKAKYSRPIAPKPKRARPTRSTATGCQKCGTSNYVDTPSGKWCSACVREDLISHVRNRLGRKPTLQQVIDFIRDFIPEQYNQKVDSEAGLKRIAMTIKFKL